MSITRTQLDTGTNVNNLSAYNTTVSISPAASTLVIIKLRTHYTTAGSPTVTVTSNAGLNLTWSNIKQTDFTTIASPTDTILMAGALSGSTPGTGTVHVAISKTCSGLIWEIIQLSGVDLSGGTVASTVQQTGSGSSDTAGTTLTDTFGSAVSTNNAVMSCAGQAVKTGGIYTWNNSFTKGIDTGSGENTAYNLTTGFILSGFTGTTHTVTSTSSTVWGIIGAEIKVAPPANLTPAQGGIWRNPTFFPLSTGRLFRDEGWTPVQPPRGTQDRPWVNPTFATRPTAHLFVDDSLFVTTPPPPIGVDDGRAPRPLWVAPVVKRQRPDDDVVIFTTPAPLLVDDGLLPRRFWAQLGIPARRADDGAIIFQAPAALVASDDRFPQVVRRYAMQVLQLPLDDSTVLFQTTPPPPTTLLRFHYDP